MTGHAGHSVNLFRFTGFIHVSSAYLELEIDQNTILMIFIIPIQSNDDHALQVPVLQLPVYPFPVRKITFVCFAV